MRDRVRSAGMAALVLLAAVSAGVAGEPRSAEAVQETTQAPGGEAQQPDAAGERSTALNGSFAYPVSDRCEYRASVRGVVNTAKAWDQTGQGSGALLPSLRIEGALECPDGVSLSVNDTLTPERPMTRAELEAELERRAAVPTLESAGRCSYAPDLLLSDYYFTSTGVTYLCAAGEAATSPPRAP